MFENICNNSMNTCSCNCNCNQNIRCNKKRKSISIINAILTDEEIINPDSAIPFNAKRVYISDDIIQDNNTDFKICTPGIYKATFTTNSKLYNGENNKNISIGIVINGVLIPGTIIKKSCTQNEIVNLNTQVIFSVTTVAVLKVINIKENNTIMVCDNANIIIEKIA